MVKDKIFQGDCLGGLKKIPDQVVNCIVTSPPYYGLRNYNHDHQLGLEETPELYVSKLVEIFTEAKRVLVDHGTLWVNLGDSYAGSMNGQQKNDNKNWVDKSISSASKLNICNYEVLKNNKRKRGRKEDGVTRWGYGNVPATGELKPKDLIGIPWMVAMALRKSGWYLRQDIIWHKPNPMPESVTDRCTKAHEYIFLLSKSKNYYYDQESIKQPVADSTISRLSQQINDQKGSERVLGKTNGPHRAVGEGRKPRKGIDTHGGNQGSEKGIPPMGINGKGVKGHSGYFNQAGNLIGGGMANKKSVWTVNTKGFREAHFATFPPDLIIDCIKAGCPIGGIVLDPFMGAGTTAVVAKKLGRHYLGFELNPEYIKIAESRLYKEIGMFL